MDKVLFSEIPVQFGYQLTGFMQEHELEAFVKPFAKYKDTKRGVIVEKDDLVAIFTTGSKLIAF